MKRRSRKCKGKCKTDSDAGNYGSNNEDAEVEGVTNNQVVVPSATPPAPRTTTHTFPCLTLSYSSMTIPTPIPTLARGPHSCKLRSRLRVRPYSLNASAMCRGGWGQDLDGTNTRSQFVIVTTCTFTQYTRTGAYVPTQLEASLITQYLSDRRHKDQFHPAPLRNWKFHADVGLLHVLLVSFFGCLNTSSHAKF